MQRRQFIASGCALAGVAVSGCTGVRSDEHELAAPAEDRDGPAVFYEWQRDGDALLELSLTRRADVPGIDRLTVDIFQPQETVLDAMTFRCEPAHTADTHADVYIEPPFTGGWESYDVYREDNWTVVEVDDFGEAAGSTIGFEQVVHGDIHGDEVVPPLRVEAEFSLSKDGRFGDTYTATLSDELALEAME